MSKAVKNTKEVIVQNEVKEEGKKMAEVEVKENDTVVVSEVAENATDKKAEFKADLIKRLRLFPQKISIADLIGYRTLGIEYWLPAQRKPSHTPTKALEIIDSALAEIPCGVISLGLCTDNDEICTINGSSRIDDFIRYYTGVIGKKEHTYKDLPTELAKKFLNHTLRVDWHNGTEKELIRDFKNLNNDVALTGGQKAVTNLVGSSAMVIVNALNGHNVFTTMFSARQLQKQEQNNCLFLIMANILDCYNAKIDTVTKALADTDCTTIDIEKLTYIFDKIESADVELNKYKFIHLAHLMYIGDCWKSKSLHHEFDIDSIDDTAIGVAISCNYVTSGTNSVDANNDRIAKMAKKLYLHFKATPIAPVAPQNDVLDPESL